jgi:hypothetical protein
MTKLWQVYGGPPTPQAFTSKRAARRLMRRYRRLGIQASLYSGDELIERRDGHGQRYRLADDDAALVQSAEGGQQ